MSIEERISMIIPAKDLLEEHGNDIDMISRYILYGCDVLDKYGAWEWDLLYVTISSIVIFGIIKFTIGKSYGIDWYVLVHAIISTIGSFGCIYLDLISSKILTNIEEPLRSVQCYGPLTSLHKFLPCITMGFSIYDCIDGIRMSSIDFTLHGLVTFTVIAIFVHINATHILSTYLFMELSTIPLNLVKATFLSTYIIQLIQVLFIILFFLCRIVIIPYYWAKLIISMWEEENNNSLNNQCFPNTFKYYVFFFGLFFHCLNAYWFRKIIRKAKRKIFGNNNNNEKDNNNNKNEKNTVENNKKQK